jgi:hypothetical protein
MIGNEGIIMVQVTIAPVKMKDKPYTQGIPWKATVDGRFITINQDKIVFSAARKLVEMGYDPQETMHVFTVNGQRVFKPQPVAIFAKYDISENAQGTPIVRKFYTKGSEI